MKKIFFSLLAIAAIASCAKTEAVYSEGDSEIQIAPVTSVATKANVKQAIDGIIYPKKENFDVYAYWANQPAGSKFTTVDAAVTNYLIGTDGYGIQFQNKGQFWGGTTTYYWPKNGSLRFAAYSPSSLDMGHVLATDTYTLSNFAYPSTEATEETYTNNTYEILVAPTTESYTAQTAAEKVSVVFEHALSWITFKVKCTNVANGAFKLENIIVNDIENKGTLTADMIAGTKTWALTGNTTDVKLWNGPKNVTTTADTYETVNNGFLVLPQATTSVTLNYTQNALTGTPELTDQTITIPLTLDGNEGWEPGKHYTYTIIFDLDEILINPSVADWEDVVVNDTPATEIVATTEAELVTAINNGGQVRLGADIVTTENFHVYESINIDLNGYTLTANVGDEIFARVYNGATFTIGRGTVVCDDYMVSVNAGGVAVINDGVYTAETTVVNVNGGQAYITGGMFKDNSTYNGQYLINHVDAQKNNGLIEITGGSFVNFNPAAASSEYPAMNFVKAGYNVTCVGNVYTVTAANVETTLAANTEIEATYNVAGTVLDGAGKTISVETGNAAFVTGNTFRFINVTGDATIKNIVIDGNNAKYGEFGIRAIFLAGAGEYNIENVTIKNVTYTINDDAAAKTLNVTDSVLEGWTSYNKNTTATFTSVEFKKGTYATFRPQGATVLTNCAFEAGFEILLDLLTNPIVFDNCTYNGAALVETDLKNAPAGLVTIQ